MEDFGSDEETFANGMDCEKGQDGGDVSDVSDHDVPVGDGEPKVGGEKADGGYEVEDESIGQEIVAVTLEQRLDAIDAKLADLRMGMAVIGERLGDLIAVSNNQVEANHGKRDVVTALMFETYVDQAISNGHSLGVSRSFIQEFITKTFSLPCNKYLQRRIGATLRRKVSEGSYKLENNLYSFYREQSREIDP